MLCTVVHPIVLYRYVMYQCTVVFSTVFAVVYNDVLLFKCTVCPVCTVLHCTTCTVVYCTVSTVVYRIVNTVVYSKCNGFSLMFQDLSSQVYFVFTLKAQCSNCRVGFALD